MVSPSSIRHSPLRYLSSRAGALIVLCICALLLLISQPLTTPNVLAPLHSLQHDRDQCDYDDKSSPYRRRLNAIRPLDRVPHSKTLGVAGRIYVVSLPQRKDRRELMSALERAMDLEFTWHDATDYHSKEIQDIRERVRWWRSQHRTNASMPNADPSPFMFKWADDVDQRTGELGVSGADLWTDTFGPSPLPPLPSPPSPDTRAPVLDAYGEQGSTFGNMDIRMAQYSCWHSHYRVLRRIAEGAEDVAIVFEDDVDMEWDLERRLRRMWEALPDDWDLIMIGHCQSQEWKNPPLKGAPNLHPTSHTLCTHAYAVTRRAAQHMVRRMRSESFAYSRNVDHGFQHLLAHRHIKAFSIYPPVVVQTYEMESDIMPGRPPGRHDWLVDSAMERLELANKEDAAQNLTEPELVK